MQQVKQVIDEIRDLKKEPSHKSSLRIFSLMENNKKQFSEIMDPVDYLYLLSGFENVSSKSPGEFKFDRCIEEYNQLCENFLFHCNRVV